MTGAGYRVGLDGREAALEALAGIAARLANAQPMYEIMGASLVTSTQRRFEEGIGPDGSPWPPSLRVLAQGGKTLVLSARLMQSVTFNASDAGLEVGSNAVYAAIHQLGGEIARPARQQTIYRRYDARDDELSGPFVKKARANFAEDVNVPAHSIRMPARPFLGLDDGDERELLMIAEEYAAGDEARP